jgi:hypothetical protein
MEQDGGRKQYGAKICVMHDQDIFMTISFEPFDRF